MILIEKNSSNRVALTLNEKRTLDNPFYIFRFQEMQTEVYTIFYAVNTSVNKDRYDLFNIIENPIADHLNGTVTLTIGEYTYEVYESVTISLDPDDWTSLVENGRVTVVGEEPGIAAYESEEAPIATY